MPGDSSTTEPLPQIEKLFFVALQALASFEEPVRYRVADERAIEIPDMVASPQPRQDFVSAWASLGRL